jgi:hypothetical protein
MLAQPGFGPVGQAASEEGTRPTTASTSRIAVGEQRMTPEGEREEERGIAGWAVK